MRLLLSCFLLLRVSHGFHYTCEQLRDELIPNRVQLPTKYACVVFEYADSQIHMPYYDTVVIRDTVTSKEYSLTEVSGSCNHCVEGNGWEVVSKGDFPVLCNTEIILLFTSLNSKLTLGRDESTLPECEKDDYAMNTLVTPNGVSAHFQIDSSFKEDVSIFLGIGKDESEDMYPIRDWKYSESTNLTLGIFDWVVTANSSKIPAWYISNDAEDSIHFDYTTSMFASSAILGNAHWRKRLVANTCGYQIERDPVIRVTGFIHFNSSNSISLIAEDAQIDILDSGSIDLTMYGDFQFVYDTHPENYENARVNESFVLYFDLVRDSPPPETLTTTDHNISPTYEPGVQGEPYCSCDVDEDGIAKSWASEIWLDIVILIDTSKSMGTDGVDEVSEVVESFISMMNLDSNGPSELYSRVGLISLSNTVEVIYNLNMTSESEVNLKNSNALYVDIEAGFQAAMTMFKDGRRMHNYRRSARQIIYFITNSNPQGILNGVHEFKESGGIIIVADYVREGQVPLDGLRTLASPHYFFTNLTSDYTYNLQVLCDANCFCPPDMHALNDESVNRRQDANRGCYHVANSGIPFNKAIKTCEKEDSVMTTIHDDEKQFFISSIVSEFPGPKTKYWIGYQNDGNSWRWIDKSSNPYTNWDVAAGQPNTSGGQHLCAYSVQTTGLKSQWYAANCNGGYYFVCEKAPCAAGRYCTFED